MRKHYTRDIFVYLHNFGNSHEGEFRVLQATDLSIVILYMQSVRYLKNPGGTQKISWHHNRYQGIKRSYGI